jgi:hypothetical protein
MKKLVLVLAVAFLAAAPAASALDRVQARAILRLAVKASGLQAREQVRIVVEKPAALKQRRVRLIDRAYPPPLQAHDETVYRALGFVGAGKGVLRKALIEVENGAGLYDPLARTAFVRSGAGERAAALHEVVHALQDQHYDLRRIPRSAGTDARLAALAAVEGHAGLVTGALAPKQSPVPTGPKLTRYLELQRGFVYDLGLRFAADLRNLGGRPALLGSLKRFPATTEQVFHLDKYLEAEKAAPIVLPVDAAGLRLAGTGSFGELDARALLAVFDVPRLAQAATGWGGGRTAVYRAPGAEAVALALDWDTERDAAEWAEAMTIYVNEAFDADVPGLPAKVACEDASACWQLGAHGVAFRREGVRTVLVLSLDALRSAALAAALVP